MAPIGDKWVREHLLIEQQMQNLQSERTAYSERIRRLVGAPEHVDELKGYLRIIENINAAAIILAMQQAGVRVHAG